MIIFLHVPKTAGTTFQFILENSFGIAHCHTFQIRKPVFLGPYVPAAMVRNNDAMAAQYANQLLAQYPGMTRDQAKVEARKLFP